MSSPILLQSNVALRAHNTFGIDAAAASYLRVLHVDDLRAVAADHQLAAMPRLVLGGGSNIVLTGDFPGLVLHMCTSGVEVTGETQDAVLVTAAAGENWHRLVDWTLQHGLGGLENLSLIPGSVGASPIQNIGAYGIELKDRFHSLRMIDMQSGAIRSLNRDECGFSYRDSIFKHTLRDRAVILDVTLALPRRWQACIAYAELANELRARGVAAPTARQVAHAVIAIRQRKLPDPATIGNAGSFFKNPVVGASRRDELVARHPALVSYLQADGSYKLAAGWLIDQCGWKGRSLGAAGVYEKQALVLVNRGGATGAEVMHLANAIRADVAQRFGVDLEPEPVVV
ncbi:UDP-N-acetylmuramate dehydrogenase [Lacisediminimonas sp.]|uniref:UDP-N-acetylmuramate dehydrogenase n=1 Tax=Lacisediminimonas sp. TaxID=3060582 RepID=UPI00271E9ED0|nr:UDP-N-acetylmuramate dehydrogenase [Lacisediminimonas sp.]MDO8300435.1 UDP-N-acetylmuramate dehydrogenase [Lacisediminimonas sp.]